MKLGEQSHSLEPQEPEGHAHAPVELNVHLVQLHDTTALGPQTLELGPGVMCHKLPEVFNLE